MAQAAAAAALVNHELDRMDGTSVRANRSTSALGSPGGGISKTGTEARKASADLNQFTGRLSLLATVGATLGPALLPIGATAIPALTSLAAGLGVTVGAVGTAVLAFHGLGDALTALNKYQLDPSDANLKKLHETLGRLSPAAQELVMRLDSLGPVLHRLQRAAQNGLFPGVDEGLTQVLTLLPEVETVVSRIAAEMGSLATQAGVSLAHDSDWQAFFHWLETDAVRTLDDFARATGNFVAGLGSMLVAFNGLDRDFTGGLLRMSRGFREWAATLDQNSSFQDFVDYVRENGPQVREFFGALGGALVALARAAAPWGSAILPILTDVARVFAAIGDSPIGPPLYTAAAAMLALKAASGFLGNMSTNLGKVGVNAGVASTKLASLAGRTAGILAIVGAVGALTDSMDRINSADLSRNLESFRLGADSSDIEKVISNIKDLDSWTNKIDLGRIFNVVGVTSTLQKFSQNVDQVDQSLANMVESGNADQAAQIWQHLVDIAHAQGVDVGELRKHFDSYKTALDNAKSSTNDLAGATDKYGSTAGKAMIRAEELKRSLDAQRDSARQTGKAFMAFGSSLDDTKVSLGSWITEMQNQANALRDFTKNTQTAAKRGLREGLLKELEAAGPAGALRMKQLANATDAEIKKANKAWKSGQDAIRAYQNMVVPPKKIDIDSDGAISAIEALRARLIKATRDPITQVIQISQRGGDSKRIGMAQDRGADGTTVPKTGLPYADRHLYLLADGEEVISNRHGQADRHRSLLKAINAGRLADGGTARYQTGIGGVSNPRSPYMTASLFGIDIDRDDSLKKKLRLFGLALDKSKKALDDETSARDSLIGSVKSNLMGDLWGSGSNASPFSSRFMPGSVGAVNANLQQQIRDAREQGALEKQLRARGVSGDALQEVIANGGLSGLRSFASSSNADLRQYQYLFGQRGAAVSSAASAAADVLGMTSGINATNAEIKALTATVKSLQKQLERHHRDNQNAPARTGQAVVRANNRSARNARTR
jgi:hypothetical protein